MIRRVFLIVSFALLSASQVLAEPPRLSPDKRLPWKIANPDLEDYYGGHVPPKPTQQIFVQREFVDKLQKSDPKTRRQMLNRFSNDSAYHQQQLATESQAKKMMRDYYSQHRHENAQRKENGWRAERVELERGTSYRADPPSSQTRDTIRKDPVERRIRDQEERARQRAERYQQQYTRQKQVDTRIGAFDDRSNARYRIDASERMRSRQEKYRVSPFTSPSNDQWQAEKASGPRSPFVHGRPNHLNASGYDRSQQTISPYSQPADPIVPGRDESDSPYTQRNVVTDDAERTYIGEQRFDTTISPFESQSQRRREQRRGTSSNQPLPLVRGAFE